MNTNDSEDIDVILGKYGSYFDIATDRNSCYNKIEAKQALDALIASRMNEARIDELARIDGFAYGTDYGDYQIKRIQELKLKQGNSND